MTQKTIIRGYKRVGERVGKSRAQICRDIKAGKFPAPIVLGPNAVGWFENEIEDWLETRPRVTWATNTNPEPRAA